MAVTEGQKRAEDLYVEILTPEKVLFKGSATLAVIPGENGDIGILPHHSSFVSTLRPGLITLHLPGKDVKVFFTFSGCLSVTDNTCLLMVEHAEDFLKITLEQIQEEIRGIEGSLSSPLSPEDISMQEEALLIAKEKLKLLNRLHPDAGK